MSDEDHDYNCVAWAAGKDDRWWWPWPNERGFYWPPEAPRERTVEAFVQAFATLGYRPCEGPELEPGFEKVAIYADWRAVPTHMARQLRSGAWTSKIGSLEDIRHKTLEGLEDNMYGSVARILRRPMQTSRRRK